MQSEDFDKKIKEAAEHHHPAYDEKAWDKMESLLDKHMPTEKDDRRRFVFWLLLLAVALMGGGVYYLKTNETKKDDISLTDKLKKEPAKESVEKVPDASVKAKDEKSNEPVSVPAANKTVPATDKSAALTDKAATVANGKEQPQKNELNIKRKDITLAGSNSKTNNNKEYKPVTAKAKSLLVAGKQKNTASQNQRTAKPKYDAIGEDLPVEKQNKAKETAGDKTITSPVNTDNSAANTVTVEPNTSNSVNSLAVVKPAGQDSALQNKAADTIKTEAKDNNTIAQQKPTPKPGKRKSGFAITFTAMPDLSTVGITKAGKVKLGYGAGLSYTFNRFTVRSGFYIGRKVYTAGGDDYHPKKPNWVDYVNLQKVDADCKVYEIPFLVSYNFAQSKKSNWFFSTGLSTYLMKRENYDYQYTYPGSTDVHWKTTTLDNEYKHFFSILNISAGYERRINNILSVSAEPYFKVPLDGIGYGKIQLNSAGIALTLSIKPFTPKK